MAEAAAGVAQARQYTDDVEFSPEDATRSDFDFMCEVLQAAVDNGATTLNIPDTVGYGIPEEFGARDPVRSVSDVNGRLRHLHPLPQRPGPGRRQLAGRRAGRRPPGRGAINGLGERAGNAALEEIVMAHPHPADHFAGVEVGVRTEELARPAGWSGSPATRSSTTRPSSGGTPSPTSPASTSTACSTTARPTRSSTPARSGTGEPDRAGQALGATPSPTRSRRWASPSRRRPRTPRSAASRSWPTARSRSPTPTSRPSWPRSWARGRRLRAGVARGARRAPWHAGGHVLILGRARRSRPPGGRRHDRRRLPAIKDATGVDGRLLEFNVSSVTGAPTRCRRRGHPARGRRREGVRSGRLHRRGRGVGPGLPQRRQPAPAGAGPGRGPPGGRGHPLKRGRTDRSLCSAAVSGTPHRADGPEGPGRRRMTTTTSAPAERRNSHRRPRRRRGPALPPRDPGDELRRPPARDQHAGHLGQALLPRTSWSSAWPCWAWGPGAWPWPVRPAAPRQHRRHPDLVPAGRRGQRRAGLRRDLRDPDHHVRHLGVRVGVGRRSATLLVICLILFVVPFAASA